VIARRRPRALARSSGGTEEDRRAEELILRGLLGSRTDPNPTPAPVVFSTRGPSRPTRTSKHGAGLPRASVRLMAGSIDSVHEVALEGWPVDAIAVGHYSGVAPQGAEKLIDDELTRELRVTNTTAQLSRRGVIADFSDRGILRGGLGEPFFIVDPRPGKNKAKARLIAVLGLGEPGRLGVPELTVAVRELCWSLGRLGKQHLASVLIGAGPGNLSIFDAVNAWVRGIRRALIDAGPRRGSSRGAHVGSGVRRITLIEYDTARIQDIAQALQAEQSRQRGAGFDIELSLPTRAERTRWAAKSKGKRARIRAAQGRQPSNAAGDPPPTLVTVRQDNTGYTFSALTENASVPERVVAVDHELVLEANHRLASASDIQAQRSLGRTLLNLVVPHELRPHLRSSAPLVLIVDATTARLHWEMMADGEAEGETSDAFLATARSVTRRLRTAFAPPPEPPPPGARQLRVLVVADPAGDARLPGAALEGMEVARLFERFNTVYASSDHQVEVTRLFGPEEATRLNVLVALTQSRYDVLHFAGHCFFDPENVADSGWVFSGGACLTARELNRIDRIPPFIFSNACESGITPERATKRALAAAPSFAEAFFARGVSNFLCTAWQVEDDAALQFATLLYTELLGLQNVNDGKQGRFGNLAQALRVARAGIFDKQPGVATWGAYQHYGTPSYRFFEAGTEGTEPTSARSTTPTPRHQRRKNER
jgi:CHAT domain-containing protein